MAKLITFFMFFFIGCTILSSIMEGGGGIVSVPLGVAVDDDDVVLTVSNTDDFLSADYVYVGKEKILYANKTGTTFTGCTRGYGGTTATSHAADSMVYTSGASAINDALGFSVAATADTMGWWAVITVPFYFLTKTLPHAVMMNYSFLTGTLGIVGYFLMAVAIGLVIVFALTLAGGRRV